MSNAYKSKKSVPLFIKLIVLTTVSFSVLLLALSNWQPGFAQVVDWCTQPSIVWCTSHEEFNVGDNLNTGSSYSSQNQYKSWYSGTVQTSGGYVDRNDSNYTNQGYSSNEIINGLPATITQASTSIPARSGETNTKRFLSLWNDTSFGQPQSPNDPFSSGIFLTRKQTGGLTNYMTAYPNGLFYSAWYYFPTNYTSTVTSNQNLMVMEFMTELTANSTKKWRVPFAIHLQGRPNNQMAFRVDDWSASLSSNEAYSQTVVTTYDPNIPNIPIGKWVHLEVFYKFGDFSSVVNNRGQGSGQVIVFQDGKEIYRFDNVATKSQGGSNAYNWVVTSYAYKPLANSSTPAVFHFYVEDAAISTVRLGAPRELIRNGDFANTAHWRLDDTRDGNSFSTASTTGMSASNQSAAKIDSRTGPNNPDPVLYQPIAGGLLPGVPYTLRFTAKSNTPRTMQVAIKHNGYAAYAGIEGGDLDVWTSYWNSSSCGTINLDSSPKNFVCPILLTQGVTNANAILSFGVGGISSTVWIDNVSLVQGENLVRNGDFSDTSAPWTFNLNGATASSSIDNNGGLSANDAKAIAITLTTPLADVWKPELYQTVQGGLDSGITYTVRFSAKASANSRTVWLVLQENEGSYDIIGDCATYTLTTDVQNFICTTTVSKQTNNAVLNFLLGGDAGNTGKTIWIDNVSLSRSQ